LKSYFQFLRTNFEPVFFGFLLTFFSSFGQTFLISLFVPFILADLALTKTTFGTYYATATVIASLVLLRVGHLLDDRPVRPFTNYTVLLLLISSLILAVSFHPAMLFLSLVGLRLGGQGLMSHISMTTMSRQFDKDRGKALSISSLGYSVGEMVFPFLLAMVVAGWGWRTAVFCGGLILVGFLLGLRHVNIEQLDTDVVRNGGSRTPNPATASPSTASPSTVSPSSASPSTASHSTISPSSVSPAEGATGASVMSAGATSVASSTEKLGKRAFYAQMLKESRFYILAAPSFLLSFVITGFFFYQYILAETSGWPIATYTLLFTGYGAIRLVFSVWGGVLTDRYNTTTLFVYHLLPMAAGILALAFVPGILAGALFLFLSGVTVGMGMVIKSAILAEVYGVARIGQVRSMYTVVMVISTAAAPLVFGMALDAGVTFATLAIVSASVMGLVTLHTLRIYQL
jgi:MFS family permease